MIGEMWIAAVEEARQCEAHSQRLGFPLEGEMLKQVQHDGAGGQGRCEAHSQRLGFPVEWGDAEINSA